MEHDSLLQRYRRDRRKLLEFILSSGLVKEVRAPSGSAPSLSDADFDKLSADYILHCVKSGLSPFPPRLLTEKNEKREKVGGILLETIISSF